MKIELKITDRHYSFLSGSKCPESVLFPFLQSNMLDFNIIGMILDFDLLHRIVPDVDTQLSLYGKVEDVKEYKLRHK